MRASERTRASGQLAAGYFSPTSAATADSELTQSDLLLDSNGGGHAS
jgi:hypothetical protein